MLLKELPWSISSMNTSFSTCLTSSLCSLLIIHTQIPFSFQEWIGSSAPVHWSRRDCDTQPKLDTCLNRVGLGAKSDRFFSFVFFSIRTLWWRNEEWGSTWKSNILKTRSENNFFSPEKGL